MHGVLVVGGTGLLGRAVVRELLAAGQPVRVLARDPGKIRDVFGSATASIDVVAGSVTDRDAVERAVRGCSHVHVSLAARSGRLGDIEHHGTALVAEAAARHDVQLLSYVSGSLVHLEYGPKIPEHQAKLAAERAIAACGVPHVILRPTYVIDTLRRHVHGPVALAIGHPPPLHMVAAADLARMVVRAYAVAGAAGRDLYVHGPAPVTITSALRTYVATLAPRPRVLVVPTRVMSAVDRLILRQRLRPALDVIGLLERYGEHGDPTEANAMLGAPSTTVYEWCSREAR